MKLSSRTLVAVVTATVYVSLAGVLVHSSQGRGRGGTPPTPTLGLEHGTLDFDTPEFTLKLVRDSQTIAALQPKGARGVDAATPFDFTPADQLPARQGDRFN